MMVECFYLEGVTKEEGLRLCTKYTYTHLKQVFINKLFITEYKKYVVSLHYLYIRYDFCENFLSENRKVICEKTKELKINKLKDFEEICEITMSSGSTYFVVRADF